MKLGTVVYKNKLYNLDCMSLEELENLLKEIENANDELINKGKNIINNN